MAATHLKSPSAGFVNSILDVGVIHADPDDSRSTGGTNPIRTLQERCWGRIPAIPEYFTAKRNSRFRRQSRPQKYIKLAVHPAVTPLEKKWIRSTQLKLDYSSLFWINQAI